jgi:hypothetical protein
MITQCSNCQISTAGLHEWNCPNNPRHGYVNADSTGSTSTLPKDIGIRINPIEPLKINNGSTVETPHTCENCKWWRGYGENEEDVEGICNHIKMTKYCPTLFEPDANFGCNFWESK